jgi:hypothetical protein
MRYEINADPTYWTTHLVDAKNEAMMYADAVDYIGGISLFFSYNGKARHYENEYVNIPLFLTELEDFLERVNSSVPQRWYLGLAPFAHGRLTKGELLISTRTGKAFAEDIYDRTSAADVARLKLQLSKDIRRFGKIQMDGLR